MLLGDQKAPPLQSKYTNEMLFKEIKQHRLNKLKWYFDSYTTHTFTTYHSLIQLKTLPRLSLTQTVTRWPPTALLSSAWSVCRYTIYIEVFGCESFAKGRTCVCFVGLTMPQILSQLEDLCFELVNFNLLLSNQPFEGKVFCLLNVLLKFRWFWLCPLTTIVEPKFGERVGFDGRAIDSHQFFGHFLITTEGELKTGLLHTLKDKCRLATRRPQVLLEILALSPLD